MNSGLAKLDGGGAGTGIDAAYSAGGGGSSAGNGRRGARSPSTIASIRAIARSYARSALSGRGTYGVATTFMVLRRLSKITNLSVRTTHSAGTSRSPRPRAGRYSH